MKTEDRFGFVVSAFMIVVMHAAHEMLQTEENVILLDVREYYEICGSLQHIEDAVNLPWLAGDLEARFTEIPVDATIIAVCAAGSRSNLAANFLDSQGYPHVYDMLGGMSGWTFGVEVCDPEPVLSVYGGEGQVELNWTATDGVQDYDLIRGELDAVVDAGASIDLGPVDCLANDSPFTYRNDADEPLAGEAFFYLSRRRDGSFGFSSDRLPRIPAPSICD